MIKIRQIVVLLRQTGAPEGVSMGLGKARGQLQWQHLYRVLLGQMSVLVHDNLSTAQGQPVPTDTKTC